MNITPIIEAVFALIAAIIIAVVVPYIKSRTTAAQQAEIAALVKIAVTAAEQIYKGTGRGTEKKAYVLDWLREHDVTVCEDTLDALIESAAYELPDSDEFPGSLTVFDAEEAVRDKSYSLGHIRIGGYGRPNYSLIQEGEDMNQNKFNEMFKTAMAAYRKDLRDNDSGAWSREAREYTISSGLFAGSGTAPDGTPNFMWEDLLTRE